MSRKEETKSGLFFLLVGLRGGIVILWDSNRLKFTEKVLGSFSVTVKLNFGEEGSFWLTSMYGPNKPLWMRDFGWSYKTYMV